MRINFYEAMLSEDDRTTLVKEKGINYQAEKINSPKEIATMMQELLHIEELAEERCYMIALSSSCKVLGMFFLSKGTVNTSPVSPREIFVRALLIGAVQIIFCHNHPSGDASPSKCDIQITEKIKQAGEMIGISLIDHIIIGRGSYFSFNDAGIL